MAKQLQLRRGTTAEHSTFTGAAGEITVDTTKDTAVVHDGVTVGGTPLATEASLIIEASTRATEDINTLASAKAYTDNAVGTNVTTVASSVLLSGNLALADYAVTKNFATVTYTGNGSTQNINTGIPSVDFTVSGNGSGYWLDRSVNQVKNDAGVVQASGSCVCNVSKVHIKSRGLTKNHIVVDGLRGNNIAISTDLTGAEASSTTSCSFNTSGFTVGNHSYTNSSGDTLVAYQTLYTHIKWGTTNQGKFYVEAYNPVTREGMIYYIGSGLAGHEIPHSQGVELDWLVFKNLSNISEWTAAVNGIAEDGNKLVLNTTAAIASTGYDSNITDKSFGGVATTDTYISYYKAKSETWTIVQYQGTGASGNFVETKDVYGVARKPRRIVTKKINSTGSWGVFDSKRTNDGYSIYFDRSGAESTTDQLSFNTNGFELLGNYDTTNISGGTYIALVEFDTNGDGGDGYFNLPTDDSNLNLTSGVFSYTNGIGSNGYVRSTESYSGTIDFAGMSDGMKWIAKTEGGSFVAYDKKPSVGIYEKESADDNRLVFIDGKYYTTTGGELVTNGTFDNGTTGYWASGATLNNNDNVLNVVGGTTNYPKGVLDLSGLVVGEKYKLSVDIIATGDATSVSVYESGSYSLTYSHQYGLSTGTHIVEFTAEYTTLRILLGNHSATDNQTTKFDNVSLFKLEPTLSTPVSTPISFLPNPVMVASETPMYIDYNDELAQNVVDSIEASGDIVLNGTSIKEGLIGHNQTWQNMTSERALGIAYLNDTGKPIMVQVLVTTTSTYFACGLIVDGIAINTPYIAGLTTNGNYGRSTPTVIVPNGSTYKAYGTPSVANYNWRELR